MFDIPLIQRDVFPKLGMKPKKSKCFFIGKRIALSIRGYGADALSVRNVR